MENKLTIPMIEHLNLNLKEEGSCLRYVESSRSNDVMVNYKLEICDKYIDNKYAPVPNVTNEFEYMVKEFFIKKYNVSNTGFSNTVSNLVVML